jgi:hypothetical protein
MFDDFTKTLDEIKRLEDPAKVSAMQTWFVIKCVMAVVYYVVAGVVAWALGRRLIQATFAALREARRSGLSD